MAEIICLANSFKGRSRCIAGIDLETTEWVRPYSTGHEGAIGRQRFINGTEPELLDILDIPLGPNAEDLGCQPENRRLLSGKWKKIGEITEDEAMQYTENTDCLLHNIDKRVPYDYFKGISESEWKSLQLIHVKNASFSMNPWNHLECNFRYSGEWYSLKTTCPEADALEGSRGNYLLTISMTGPYKRKASEKLACWKLIAGVIELD